MRDAAQAPGAADRHGLPLDVIWATQAAEGGAADAVYATLRHAILDGALPPNERLNEEALAQRFRVSRTPVREALNRLETERLARRISRRGLVVRAISVQETLEAYAVREALDGLAARLAASGASPPEIAQLRWLNERLTSATAAGDFAGAAALNLEFHTALCSAAHNGLLLQFTERIHEWVRRLPYTTFSYPGRGAEIAAEHERIIAAIAAGDATSAESEARAHMGRARAIRVLMLDEAS